MRNFIITEEQVSAILKYLVGKPYCEVVVGIQILKSLPEYKGNIDIGGEGKTNEG